MTSTAASARDTTPPFSERSQVRRAADRAHYDRPTVHAIVDAAHVCHVAFAASDEAAASVLCIPTVCWRVKDQLFIHGSNGSRMMKRLGQGASACVTITHLDGLVLARSAYSHSMNYRSVVIHGRFEVIPLQDKPAVLEALMAHLAHGRQHEARAPDSTELNATTVLSISLAEAAAKVRQGGPCDKPQDRNHPAWSGVLPLHLAHGAPQPASDWAGLVPAYVSAWAHPA